MGVKAHYYGLKGTMEGTTQIMHINYIFKEFFLIKKSKELWQLEGKEVS